jgi:hypothetical protein
MRDINERLVEYRKHSLWHFAEPTKLDGRMDNLTMTDCGKIMLTCTFSTRKPCEEASSAAQIVCSCRARQPASASEL